MQDQITRFQALRRPRLLISAARAGVSDYKRKAQLIDPQLSPLAALERLLDQEEALDAARRSHAASYSAFAHVEVLIAAMGEAQALFSTPYETAAE